ncbi:hypothetical protein INR49_013548 [Caranx melampygus]|nr:hypothetical protein INR49_013548 [Caranx melampygus]
MLQQPVVISGGSRTQHGEAAEVQCSSVCIMCCSGFESDCHCRPHLFHQEENM